MVCFANWTPAVATLPLTLTLSPPAGRGDVPCERWRGTKTARHVPSPRKRGEGGGSRMRGRAENRADRGGHR
ncbi:hypothetical protein ELG62_17505 [Rhizobium leguminosarum]|nr:hypothetical protein ELG62_17505 [Rhizobium leguminosarum]